MFCEKCGAPNVDGAAFCSGCGASLNSSPFRPAQPLQPAKPLPVQPQSAAAQPVVPQPVVPQPQHRVPEAWPVAPQPVAPQPVAPQPVAPQPVVPQPVVPQPQHRVPEAWPVAPQPVAPQPVAPQPQPRVLETWPVAPQPQSVAPQSWPVEPQTQYNVGSAEMSTPKKSKKKIWVLISLIVAILIAAAVAVYFIWVKDSGKDDSEQKSTTVSTKNANDSAENVALVYFESLYTCDWETHSSTFYTDTLYYRAAELFKNDTDGLPELIESGDFELDELEVGEIDAVDDEEYEEYVNYFDSEHDLEVTDVKQVEVIIKATVYGEGKELSSDLTVVEIDGEWYAADHKLR